MMCAVTRSARESVTRRAGDASSERALTWLPTPSRKSMKKKRPDQSGASGMRLSARGYTINARPGPESMILSTSMSY